MACMKAGPEYWEDAHRADLVASAGCAGLGRKLFEISERLWQSPESACLHKSMMKPRSGMLASKYRLRELMG